MLHKPSKERVMHWQPLTDAGLESELQDSELLLQSLDGTLSQAICP